MDLYTERYENRFSEEQLEKFNDEVWKNYGNKIFSINYDYEKNMDVDDLMPYNMQKECYKELHQAIKDGNLDHIENFIICLDTKVDNDFYSPRHNISVDGECLVNSKIYYNDGREPFSFSACTNYREMFLIDDEVEIPFGRFNNIKNIDFLDKLDFLKEFDQNNCSLDEIHYQKIVCLLENNIENQKISFEELINKDMCSRYFNDKELINIVDKNNQTCMDAVIDNGNIELIDKLSKVGALTKEELDEKAKEEVILKSKSNDNDLEV